MKRRAFGASALLIALIVMTGVSSLAIHNHYKDMADFKKEMISDIKAYSLMTEKIISIDNEAPYIDFDTSLSDRVYYHETEEGDIYTYPLSKGNMNLQIYKTLDPATETVDEHGFGNHDATYTSYGIILRSYTENKCLVFEKATDSRAYWSLDCDPDSIGWDYEI